MTALHKFPKLSLILIPGQDSHSFSNLPDFCHYIGLNSGAKFETSQHHRWGATGMCSLLLVCVEGGASDLPIITNTEESIIKKPLKRESSPTNGGSSIMKAIKPH